MKMFAGVPWHRRTHIRPQGTMGETRGHPHPSQGRNEKREVSCFKVMDMESKCPKTIFVKLCIMHTSINISRLFPHRSCNLRKLSPYRLERKHKEKEEQVAYKLEQEIALWDPNSRENSTQDPFKTLFVARINYDTSQSKLR